MKIQAYATTLLMLVISATTVVAQEQKVEPRIAGLEHNAEYMSLLREDSALQMREDSIASVIVRARQMLRDDVANRTKYAEQIMQGENAIFEVRNAKGRVIDRINTIEQEWVLQHMNAMEKAPAAPTPSTTMPDSLQQRDLIRNTPFGNYLARPDYVALQVAQHREMRAVDCVNRYLSNYMTLGELAQSYAAAPTEEEAVALQERFEALEGVNERLADSLSETWNYIYDNKSYAYDYLMEALGKEQQLDRQTERYNAAMRQVAALEGTTVSDELVDYFVRKRALVEYETAVADELSLSVAADSLRGVAAQLADIDFEFPRVSIEQRYFLQYDSIEFVSKPRYTASNPIPECTVYEHGTIYRVLIGTFSPRRPVYIFHGTVPLSYLETDEGKWRYFAGGFATEEEAVAAQALLKKRGFSKPQVVVWVDGVYRNLAEEPQPSATSEGYRLEIHGLDTLSQEVREAITETYESPLEISKVGGTLFVVGTFPTREDVDRVAEAVRAVDSALDVRVKELAPAAESAE